MKSDDKAPAPESEYKPKPKPRPEPKTDHRPFLSLVDLLDMGTHISVLAEAIQNYGIYGWDRFNRFTKFSKDVSKGDDAVIYSKVLDALARQHAWECDALLQRSEQSPIELTEYPGPFCFGWYEDAMPNLKAIAAGVAAQPIEPQRKPSVREENNDKVLIGVLLEVMIQREAFPSQAALIKHLIDEGYDSYEGIKESTLEAKFAKANSFLLPKHLRK